MATAGAYGAGGLALPTLARAAAMPLIPYTADSFFKSRVLGAVIDTNATAAFQAFMRNHPEQMNKRYPRINGIVADNEWGTNFHLGASTDPIWRLTGPGVRTETRIAATQGFHMADSVADRFPSGSQDRPGLMNDPIFGYSIHFADAVPDKGTRTISVQSCGIFRHASNGLDGRNPRSNESRNVCSRGRIPDAMVIRGDLVRAATVTGSSLGHVLQMFFVETDTAARHCHPMVGAENNKDGFGAEGLRIALKPRIDLAARGLNGGALVVARTLQEYGCYLGDNSGASSTLKGEQASANYSPYAGTNISPTCLSALNWTDFVVLQPGWQ
jgi:hypothetical protein